MQFQFDARNVAPDQGPGEALPAGWYNVMIDETEVKPNSAGDGEFLQTRYVVLDGQHKGRKVIGRFNTRNPNPDAVRIGYGQLSALCHAVNVLVMQDSQQLHGIPLKIKLSVKQGSEKKDKDTGQPTGERYEPSNDVKAWKGINEPTESAAVPGAQAQPQAPAAPAGWGGGAPAPAPAGWAPPGAPAGYPQPPQAQPPQYPAAPAPGQPPQWQAGNNPTQVQPPAPAWQPPAAPPPAWQPPAPAPAAAPAYPAPAGPPGGAPPWAAGPAAAPAGPPAGYPSAPPGSAPPWGQPPQA